MKPSANFVHPIRSPRNGFSLVELILSLVVLMIISTLAIPVIMRSLQSYQLNSAASQLAGMLKFTKFDAIRQNAPVSCQIKQQGSKWLVWVDSNGNGEVDQAEPQMFIGGGGFTLLPDGTAPSPTPITSSLGPGYGNQMYGWTVLSGANNSISYDQRGVKTTYTVSVLYLGSSTDPSVGYRAIITMPSGAVQVWSSSSSGDWHRVS